MKYFVVLGDGMADYPIKELGGKTPLEYSSTPCMDELAPLSEIGLAATIPPGMKPGSDTANLAVLGYDPQKYYSGRSPLEALSIGVNMDESDIALRTNIVTISDEDDLPFEERIMIDHSAGDLTSEEAAPLLDACREVFENEEFQFYLGTGYRHCCIWKGGKVLNLSQPHDYLTKPIGPVLPDKFGSDSPEERKKFAWMCKKSFEILNHLPFNEERRRQGKHVANCLWFWGAGTKPSLDPFEEKYGKKGAMISAVDLLKGIGKGTGMKVIEVPGANALLNTNYEGKANAALDVCLKDGYDLAYVHVEAPDEMGHQGSFERKIQAIENLDQRVIRIIVEGMRKAGEPFRLLVTPDHPTPVSVRTHTSDPVPFMIYDSTKEQDHTWHYNEKEAKEAGLLVKPGYKLMSRFLELE